MTMTNASEKRITELLLQLLEEAKLNQSPQNNTTGGGVITFSQAAAVLFAIFTLGGGILAAWNGVTSKLDTQKVSTDLIIEQIHKDIDNIDIKDKELRTKYDNHLIQMQTTIKELNNKIDDLDSTVNQLYTRSSQSNRNTK